MFKSLMEKIKKRLRKKTRLLEMDVPVITPHLAKKIMEKADILPGVIFSVITSYRPESNYLAGLFVAIEVAMDEVTEIVAILSGLELEYIREEVSLTEIIEYLTKVVKSNRFEEITTILKDYFQGRSQAS